MDSFFSKQQQVAIWEKRGASGCAPVDPELVTSIRECGLLRKVPLDLNFDGTMLAKLNYCLQEFRKTVLSEDKKPMLKQGLKHDLVELIKKTPEDFLKGLEQIPRERYEDAHALPIFVQNLISAQKLDVGPTWHKYARTLPAFLQNLIGVPPELEALAKELARRIATVVGGTGEPSSSVSNVSNAIVPDGHYPKTICYIKEARIYTGNGACTEVHNAYAAFCKGHQDMESRLIPFFSKLAAAEDSRRRMTSCSPCLEQGLHPFALIILIHRPHAANMVERLMRIAAAKQVWSPERTKRTLRILEHCMPRVIEAFREWITPDRIPTELWPKVYPNFPNTTGAQTLLTRVLDAILLIEDPTNEEFKQNARAVRERCNDVQGERLDFLLEAVNAWLPFLHSHSSDENTQLYKDCQFLLLLFRAVHLRRILRIGGFKGPGRKAMKAKLETVTWQILQAIDPSLASKETIIMKIDGTWRDCTKYVRDSLHPAGDAILMAANGKDVTTYFSAFHAPGTKALMMKECPEVRIKA
ncbi:unnamed protein product [Symbiodinium sp. CCMP2592]|nr:unnamed protein product [Symbiodinium sp. CCMP2592]